MREQLTALWIAFDARVRARAWTAIGGAAGAGLVLGATLAALVR
jgi:ElaB/YqjD/DUF883 family membrane-anchored ribosome-binding protein